MFENTHNVAEMTGRKKEEIYHWVNNFLKKYKNYYVGAEGLLSTPDMICFAANECGETVPAWYTVKYGDYLFIKGVVQNCGDDDLI